MRGARPRVECTDASTIGRAAFCERAAWIGEQPDCQEPLTVEAVEGQLIHSFAEDLEAVKLYDLGKYRGKGSAEKIADEFVQEIFSKNNYEPYRLKIEDHAKLIKLAGRSPASKKRWDENGFREEVEAMLLRAAPPAAWVALNYRSSAMFCCEQDIRRHYFRNTKLRIGGIPNMIVAFGDAVFPIEVATKVSAQKIWQGAACWLAVAGQTGSAARALGMDKCKMADWYKIATYGEPGSDHEQGNESTYFIKADCAGLSRLAGELYMRARRGEPVDAKKMIVENGIACDENVAGIMDFVARKQTPGWLPRRAEFYSKDRCAKCYRVEVCERLDTEGR